MAARRAWLGIIFGPALLLLLGSVAAMLWLPHPVPRTAAPAQKTYLAHCASCHGADGRGSWRAALFLTHPGDLTHRDRMAALSDEYLFNLIKHGGATIGKPGMPAFGFHLPDDQIRELIIYLRTFPGRAEGRRTQ